MKSSLTLVASACAVFEASSFVIRPSRLTHEKLLSASTSHSSISAFSDRRFTKPTVLGSATVGQSETRDGRSSRPRRTPTINEQLELETIRKELINKYVSLGHSIDDATSEVEYFLEDEERCREYVEMRRKAMARGDDLGIEMIVQFGGAFLFGWMVSAMAHNFHEIQVGLMSVAVCSFSRHIFEFLTYMSLLLLGCRPRWRSPLDLVISLPFHGHVLLVSFSSVGCWELPSHFCPNLQVKNETEVFTNILRFPLLLVCCQAFDRSKLY